MIDSMTLEWMYASQDVYECSPEYEKEFVAIIRYPLQSLELCKGIAEYYTNIEMRDETPVAPLDTTIIDIETYITNALGIQFVWKEYLTLDRVATVSDVTFNNDGVLFVIVSVYRYIDQYREVKHGGG